ncbi:MAG: hypothetical protein M0P23_00040 [Bacteroidales bacterium]|nr:hypothetical protein [Bacteroidales bacterium]MDY0174027.1 hypothetical protein [Bacteroidales bacterium]HZJ69124.1 hypothetical protein [Candidatus Eisenbacteria bacterium]
MNENTLNLYSERGIMNALIFSIWKDKEKVTEFLREFGLKEKMNFEDVVGYHFYPEYSLSDFGDTDLVIIVNYNDGAKDAIFIEAKVKTFDSSWKIKNEKKKFRKAISKNASKESKSDLFYQLRLKNMLFKNKNRQESEQNKNFAVEDKYYSNGRRRKGEERLRKIGKNGIVLKLFEELKKCTNAYFLSIVPDNIDKAQNLDIFQFDEEHEVPENIVFISWGAIEDYYKEKQTKSEQMQKDYALIIDTFENNRVGNKSQIYEREERGK